MTESVRLTWIQTMHYCAAICNAMSRLTDLDRSSSASHHVELGKSRISRDSKDLSQLIEWFQSSSPFNCPDSRLRSLATGIAVSDSDAMTL
jgi:hypothetical protein